MIISEIKLNHFRNFNKKKFSFSDKITVIVGPNASGKTNILESLYLLSSGKSFRAGIEEEMVAHTQEIARISGVVESRKGNNKKRGKIKLEVVLTRGRITIGDDPEKTERVARKKLKLNGVGKRLMDFAGNFRAVVFGPWDLDLVTESPSTRRKFMDNVLSLVDSEYRRASLSYEKGLRQRNKLLYRIREEGLSRSQLLFWDRLLIKNGDYISKKREELIAFINNQNSLGDQEFSLVYDKSAISAARLEQYAREEVAASTTLVGPHRDDFGFKVKTDNSNKSKRDLAKYGSRGEHRMAVLWLKLAELSFLEVQTETKPTLLLDDIFSELDHEHRDVVIQVVKGQQTIITTADPHFVENFKNVEIIKLGG